MNITLIYPLLSRRRSQIDENKQFWPPLGLAYIAAVLEREGHRVEIIDRDVLLRKCDMDFDRTDVAMFDMIAAFGPTIIGISATTPNMPDVRHVSDLVRKRRAEALIVLGGPHPSGEPSLSLEENPSVDIVVRGEGELTMCDIARGGDLAKIEGITYRDRGAIRANANRPPIVDLDGLPMPARHLLDMKYYTRPSRFTSRNLSLRTTSIFTARGCPYRCNFCAGPLVFSGKVRFHSTERVIAEIEELVSHYGVEALYFAEDMFLSSKKRAEEILGRFIEKGIHKRVRWFAQAKASIITDDLLRLMKEAGCVGIEYGFESGSQRVLDLMNKRLLVEDSLRAAAITRRSGMRFQANIIVGYPGEREEDFRQTMVFISKVRANMVGFNLFMPLPGTPSYENLKRDGKTLPRWEDVGDPEAPQTNYADMPKETFERLYLEARLKVILPLNLRNFIKDNIRNPIRLVRVGLTQFRGVLIKTFRSIVKLASLSRRKTPPRTTVLFLSYNGLLEPIIPSQAVPYLRELAKKGFDFILITYEKKRDLDRAGKEGVASLRRELRAAFIDWRPLRYHKSPRGLSTVYDLAVGACYVLWTIVTRRVGIVHVRGVTPGMIMLALSHLCRTKILFDMRGLLAEEYVGGGLWKEESISFRLVKKAERQLLRSADAVSVLTNKHLELNKGLDYLKNRKIPMEVVPCCVDTARFFPDDALTLQMRRELGLNGAFILMYPGKLGTFYLTDEMLSFFAVLAKTVPAALFFVVTNDDPAPFLGRAAALGISREKIVVKTGVGFSEMPCYMRLADAGLFFISPYKKIGSSPIKMGEFLASGIPVIINPGVGDTEEMVRENRVGVVVNRFADQDYADAIHNLLLLKKEGGTLGARCRETASAFLSLEKGVKKYHDLYQAIT